MRREARDHVVTAFPLVTSENGRVMDERKAIYWRGILRDARNNALGDSEGFLPIVQCMERMGNQLAPEIRKRRLHSSIDSARKCKRQPLEYSEARVVRAGESPARAIEQTKLGQPILVVSCIAGKGRLEGIVTAFDLL